MDLKRRPLPDDPLLTTEPYKGTEVPPMFIGGGALLLLIIILLLILIF